MRSIALLANTKSGDGRAGHVERLLREAGANVESFEVSEPDRAAASGAERIVVAGGDGSIGRSAAEAARAGLPIAVVAVGTANDFAVMLGLPSDLHEACELAVHGEKRRRLELGRAGDLPFVNVASVGLSPEAAEHADELKERLGVVAYPIGAVKAGALADPVECEVRCDGSILHSGAAWQVSVACTGAFGGGASLETDTTDGKLDVVVIEGGSRSRLVKHAYGMRVGTVEGQRGVLDSRCSTVEIVLDAEECLNVDGELVEASDLGADGVVRFRIESERFELVVA